MKMMMLKVGALFASVALVACSEDNSILPETEKFPVSFKMQAAVPVGGSTTRSFGPEISKEGFRILAFRENRKGEFIYTQDVSTNNMTLLEHTLSGQAMLPIGWYKFVPTYESSKTGAYTWPSLMGKKTLLSDTLSFRQTELDGSSVLFLETRSFSDLPVYAVGLSASTTDAVKSVLKRAVARVDLLFVRVKKNPDGSYTEVDGSTDVFGGQMPADISMQFHNLNRAVNLVAEQTVDANGYTFYDSGYSVADMERAVTLGNGPVTLVGTDEFIEYDNVRPSDLRSGSAHVQGAYMFPFSMGGPFYTHLTVSLTHHEGQVRTLEIEPVIPLERNKVTLVKIYLTGDDGGGDVFDSNVTFQVTVDTHWDGYHIVEGEMSGE